MNAAATLFGLARRIDPAATPRVALLATSDTAADRAFAAAFRARHTRLVRAVHRPATAAAAAHALDLRSELAWIGLLAAVHDAHGAPSVFVHAIDLTRSARGAATHDAPGCVANATGGDALERWHRDRRDAHDALMLGCKHALFSLARARGGCLVNVVADAPGSTRGADRFVAGITRETERLARLRGIALRAYALDVRAPRGEPVDWERVAQVARQLADDRAALPGVTVLRVGYASAARMRATTASRPNSASTASIDGVCARPVTATRSGTATCGILSENSATSCLSSALIAGADQSIPPARSANAATA